MDMTNFKQQMTNSSWSATSIDKSNTTLLLLLAN